LLKEILLISYGLRIHIGKKISVTTGIDVKNTFGYLTKTT